VNHSSVVASLAFALAISVAIISALSATFLSWRGGANPPNAALVGGAALGGTLALGITLLVALNVL
jgi:hypothetical protein